MVPILIALGLLGDDGPLPEPLPTPAERIIKVARNAGFTVASHALDPSDELNYLLDISALLEEGEAFSAVTLSVLPASSTLGLSIPSTGRYSARQVDDRHIAIWPKISDNKRDAQSWAGQGTVCSFEIAGVTDSDPERRWQRTLGIRVAQK